MESWITLTFVLNTILAVSGETKLVVSTQSSCSSGSKHFPSGSGVTATIKCMMNTGLIGVPSVLADSGAGIVFKKGGESVIELLANATILNANAIIETPGQTAVDIGEDVIVSAGADNITDDLQLIITNFPPSAADGSWTCEVTQDGSGTLPAEAPSTSTGGTLDLATFCGVTLTASANVSCDGSKFPSGPGTGAVIICDFMDTPSGVVADSGAGLTLSKNGRPVLELPKNAISLAEFREVAGQTEVEIGADVTLLAIELDGNLDISIGSFPEDATDGDWTCEVTQDGSGPYSVRAQKSPGYNPSSQCSGSLRILGNVVTILLVIVCTTFA